MNHPPRPLTDSKGFSLVEVIVVITVASVMFAMMFSYFGTAVLDSAQPVVRMNQTLALTQTAERITEHYKQNPTGFLNLFFLKLTLNFFPFVYGQDFSVITNKFIKFVSYSDTTDTDWDPRTLKVQILQDQTHETITLLFTKQ